MEIDINQFIEKSFKEGKNVKEVSDLLKEHNIFIIEGSLCFFYERFKRTGSIYRKK